MKSSLNKKFSVKIISDKNKNEYIHLMIVITFFLRETMYLISQFGDCNIQKPLELHESSHARCRHG